MKRIAARRSPAFTLVELMVSLVVIGVLVGILASVANESSRVWLSTTAKVDQFRETRAAFETMTARLSQATLNTYWDYNQPINPQSYERRSELRFISGPASTLLEAAPNATPDAAPEGPVRSTHCVFFQAPLGETETEKYEGFENLLCTWGFYLEWGDDTHFRPPFLSTQQVPIRYRPRLMELRQPGDSPNSIYAFTSGLDTSKQRRALFYKGREWFRNALSSSQPPVRTVAENVIALVIAPRLAKADEAAIKGSKGKPDASPLAPAYLYDSSPSNVSYTDGRLNPKAQLPPVLQVTMVAIDETSAMRLNLSAKQPDPFGLKTKFQKTEDYSGDLFQSADSKSLEATLIAQRANYRIFNTNVIIRGARWSREQLQ